MDANRQNKAALERMAAYNYVLNNPFLVRLFNAGYHKGHEDTVEAGYTDILPQDAEDIHLEEVCELVIDDLNLSEWRAI